jgi:hypothetical protein
LEERIMNLFGWLRENNGKLARRGDQRAPERRGATIRPRLEQLEDRVTPATIATTASVAVSITPNFAARTANETLTETVTQMGTTTPVTTGTVAFNINNQTGTAGLNSSGQATFSISLPLYAVASNQTIRAYYEGATVGSNTFQPSNFLAPLYLNVMNAVFASQITYGTPTGTTAFPAPFFSTGGETNEVFVFGISVSFNYVDPGTLNTFTVFGLTAPGSLSGTLFAPVESAVASASSQIL